VRRAWALAALAVACAPAACRTSKPCRPGSVLMVVTCGAGDATVSSVSLSVYDSAAPSTRRKDGVELPIACPGQASLELDVTGYQAGAVLVATVTPSAAGTPRAAVTFPGITLAPGCTAAELDLDGADGGGADGPAADGPPGDGPGQRGDRPAGLGANGDPCQLDGDCTSQHCVENVCCGGACTGSCTSCRKTATGMDDGTCANVGAGKADPKSQCAAGPSKQCGNDGFCDGSGACEKWDTTTTCADPTCTTTGYVPAGHCNGRGACQPASESNCGGYACDAATGCRTTCSTATDCASGVQCVVNQCGGKKPAGAACDPAANDCGAGLFCVDGVCCGSTCTGGCRSCRGADTNGQDGQCLPVVAGKSDGTCTDEGSSSCGHNGACDGSGGCQFYQAGTACGAGESCTGTMHTLASGCNGSGACAPGQTSDCTPFACAGGRCGATCASDNDCAPTGVCTPAGKCVRQACSSDGWCWHNPRPFGGPAGVWSNSATNVLAVGLGGSLARWDGTAWNGFNALTKDSLTAISGTSDGSTVFAVGENGTIVRFDGTSWRTVSSGTTQNLRDVWVRAANDAWAVGLAGAAVHWDGTQWNPVTSFGSSSYGDAVWSGAANDAWVAAESNLLHWNGTQWSPVTGSWMSGLDQLTGVAGNGAQERWVYAMSLQDFTCTLHRSSDGGATWTNVGAVGCGAGKLSSPGPGEVWTDAGDRWSNGTLTPGTLTVGTTSIFARTSTDVWSDFQHWNGTSWTSTGSSDIPDSLQDVSATPQGVWAVGITSNLGGSAFSWTGGRWTPSPSLPAGSKRFRGVWATNQYGVWLVGEGPTAEFTGNGGGSWVNGMVGTTANDYLNRVDATPTSNTWFVGQRGRIWYFGTGGLNTSLPAPTTSDLFDVKVFSNTDVWAVGAGGVSVHGGTQGFSPVTTGVPSVALTGVCGSSSTDVWAVGGQTVLHGNGTTWAQVSMNIPPNTLTFTDVWCVSPTEIWAVGYELSGQKGLGYRYDGTSWKPSPIGALPRAISGTSNMLWVVGDAGTVLRKAH
jgi:hypothetical protein